jgi:hypothetical protein
MYKVLEFASEQDYKAFGVTAHQLDLLDWLSYKYDDTQTMLVKSRCTTPGIYKHWELE